MFGSNYCFLTCIQISQEAGKVVWYSHLLKNFPQFVVMHTIKGFGIVNKAEVDFFFFFLELCCFFYDPTDVGNLISVCFQGKPFNITVIQVYAPTSNAEEAEVEQFYEELQDLLELTPKKDALFIIEDWNAKVGSQEIPGVTGKFGLGVRNEAGQRPTVLPSKHTGHSKHPLPTTQEKTLHMDITIWSILKSD